MRSDTLKQKWTLKNTSRFLPSGSDNGISIESRSLMNANMTKVDRSCSASSNTFGPVRFLKREKNDKCK